MSINDEINKTREKYRQKRIASPQNNQRKRIPPSHQIPVTRQNVIAVALEYITICFNIMKRDILFKVGMQKPDDEKRELMKREYEDFMEMYFK